jgi:hypothetical protein
MSQCWVNGSILNAIIKLNKKNTQYEDNEMKMKVLAAAMLIAASGSANAIIEKDLAAEIFPTVWNPAAQSSYGRDLNVSFNDMISFSGNGAGFTRDLSADASGINVSQGATAGLQFAVTGSNASLVWNSAFNGYVDGSLLLDQAVDHNQIGGIDFRYDQMIDRLNLTARDNGTGDSSFVTIGHEAYFDNLRTLWGNSDFLYDMAGPVGAGSIGFFFSQTNSSGFNLLANSLSQLGSFSLSSAGLLTYTPVPVLAAVWFLVLACLGWLA